MGLTTLDRTATLDAVLAVIERDGGVIIRDYVNPEVLDCMISDLRPKIEALSFGYEDDFAGKSTRRLGGILKHTRAADQIIREGLFRETAEHFLCLPSRTFLNDEPMDITTSIQVGVTQLIEIHPGQGAQPLHRDDATWQWQHPEGGRQARVQIMVAVSEFTAENGGTLVVPGSHLWGDGRGPSRDQAIPTVMSKGSALIWLGATYHGGGTNNSDAPRTGLTIGLDLAYLRQEENHYLTIPVSEARSIPDDIQRLVGYEMFAGFTGWVEIDGVMSDPHVLLRAEA